MPLQTSRDSCTVPIGTVLWLGTCTVAIGTCMVARDMYGYRDVQSIARNYHNVPVLIIYKVKQ